MYRYLFQAVLFGCVLFYGQTGLSSFTRALWGPCAAGACGSFEGLKGCIIATAQYKPARSSPSGLRGSRYPYGYPPYGRDMPYQQFSYGQGRAPSYLPHRVTRGRSQQAVRHPSPAAQERARIRQLFMNLLDPAYVAENTADADKMLLNFIFGSYRCPSRESCPNTACYKYFCQHVCGTDMSKRYSRTEHKAHVSNAQQCSAPDPDGKQMRTFCRQCTQFLTGTYQFFDECRWSQNKSEQNKKKRKAHLSIESDDSDEEDDDLQDSIGDDDDDTFPSRRPSRSSRSSRASFDEDE